MTTARTASPRTARAINDRIALELLVEEGPLTAARLRELTGLSRPSVADVLDRLGRGGLVTVVGEAGEDRRGPNARLYGLVARRAHVAALDVRTDGVAFTLADLVGTTVGDGVLPVSDGGGPRVVSDVLAALEAARREAGIDAVHTAVMGAPGLADPATGALRTVAGLPGWHAELLTALREGLEGRVLLENEVNLAGIAEHRAGVVRDRDTFVLLWLGHGIGAAVVLDGVLRRGASGGAGELGFLPVPGTGGLPSATDCDGGFHALAASAAVCALARSHGLRAARAGDAAAAEAVVRQACAADTGERAAFLDELAERVAVAMAGVVSVLDPGCLVLGGEVGRAGGPALADRVARRLRELSPLDTEVRAATVGGSPVLNGALLTALSRTRQELFGSDGLNRGA
ncbi:ROK family transcriptional regulator [Streptomyces sp. SBT349]|uniref:ROK family transcriptional regulator n=1 Tax=Streptomyces sp. SBT349 TaxID=1580539 RepID=UPI00066BC90A|nr:ROK family transcriptional regulator [Streptomyces sp. SBT349]